MHTPTFSVGRHQCDLLVEDPKVSNLLCNLKHMESEVYCDSLLVILAFSISTHCGTQGSGIPIMIFTDSMPVCVTTS